MKEVGWRAGIIGVSGAVGRTMARCLAESGLPIRELRGFASPRSIGRTLPLAGPWGERIAVERVDLARLRDLDLVLLSAGADVSRAWVEPVAGAGVWVVDNSSAFRMDPRVPLVVPEVNPHRLPAARGAVANPNCSTIQLVVVLAPLARRFGLARVHVATYQSVSGTGEKGLAALRAERAGEPAAAAVFPHPIDRNLLPQCDRFVEDGFTREEMKMIRETRRILEDPALPVHPTCVRVPVEVGHGEAVHLELARPAAAAEVGALLEESPGIRVLDDPGRERYPMPVEVAGSDEVWVGRIRVDPDDRRIVSLWVVADNLRKGAATNAVQIAALLYAREAGADADLSRPDRV